MIGDSPALEWLRSCPPLPPRRRRSLRRQIWAILIALAVLTVLCGVAGRYGL